MPTVHVATYTGGGLRDSYPGADYEITPNNDLHVSGGGYRANYPAGSWMSVSRSGGDPEPVEPLKVGDKVKRSLNSKETADVVHVDGDWAWITYGPDRNGVVPLSKLTRA